MFPVKLFLTAAYLLSIPLNSAGQSGYRVIPIPGIDPEALRLEANRSRLTFSLSLDTVVVLPGEDFCATVTITNSSGGPVEVFDPFLSADSGITLLKWSGTEWRSQGVAGYGSGQDGQIGPRIVISVNQIITHRFCSVDDNNDDSALHFIVGAPGTYRLLYKYSGSSVDFDVPEAKFVSLVRARLPPVLRPIVCRCDSNGALVPFNGEMRGAVIEAGDTQYLVMGRYPVEMRLTIPPPGAKGDFAKGLGIFPFVRITSSTASISDVAASAESEDKVIVAWTSGAARFHTLLGGARRPAEIVREVGR